MAVNPPNAEQAKMLNNLLKSLSPADTAKLNQILNDQEATSRVLSTPQAQELLKKLTGQGLNPRSPRKPHGTSRKEGTRWTT